MADLSRCSRALRLTVPALAALVALGACSGDEDAPRAGASSGGPGPSAGTAEGGAAPQPDAGDPDATTPFPEIVPGEDPTAHFASGTRLRVHFWSDGSRRLFSGFVDTEYGACGERLDETGASRCLPNGVGLLGSQTYYTDASCTDAVVVVTSPACEQSDPSFALLDAGTCVGCSQVHAISPPISGTAGVVLHEKSGATCVPSSRPLGAGTEIRRMGAAVSGDHFVAFEPAVFGEGRIRTRGIRAGDGAFHHRQALVDTVEQMDCAVQADRDGATRCLPALAGNVLFADATCQATPLVRVEPPATPELAASYVVPADSCSPWRTRLFPAAGAYVGPMFYGSPASCTPQGDAVEGSLVFSVGTEIDPVRFEALAPANLGDGRLQRRVVQGPSGSFAGGTQVEIESLFDTVLQVDCRPGLDREGRLRCLPPSSHESDRIYADASCSQPLFSRSSCAERTVVSYTTEPSLGCAPRHHTVVRLGPPVDVPTPYAKTGDRCTALETPTRAQPVVAEITPGALAAMIDVVE